MAFSVRTNQVLYLGASIFSGYFCLRQGCRSIQNLSRSIFGSKSISEGIEKFTIDFFSAERSFAQLIFGEDQRKDRVFNLKKSIKNAVECAILGVTSCACLMAFNLPESQESIEKHIQVSEKLKKQAEELLEETLPYIKKCEANVCYNELVTWATIAKLKDCLDLSKVNPPRFQYSRTELLDPSAQDPSLDCSNLMILLGGINFYKVDLFQHQLKGIEIQYNRILRLFKSAISKARGEFESFLSTKYLGSWKQGSLGRLISINYKGLCHIVAYEIFGEELKKDCDLYQNSISNHLEQLEKLKKAIPFTDGTRVDCSTVVSWDVSNTDLSKFSLPQNFMNLVDENKFQEVADFFISHGGTRPIESMKFNFSAIPQYYCEGGQEEEPEEIEDEDALYKRSIRAMGRDLNNKYRYLETQETFDIMESNNIFSRWLTKIKGVVVT